MRVFLFSFAAIGVTLTGLSDEPTERQMRRAFEAKVALMVQNAVDHVRETGDEEALARIRDNGTALYTLKAFHKLRCLPDFDAVGHICEFAVDLGFPKGTLQGRIAAHFYDGQLAFINRDETVLHQRHAAAGADKQASN
jgi:hypothetical protein